MKLIYTLGILVALVPFVGIPTTWKIPLFFIMGVIIAIKAFYLQKKTKDEVSDIANSTFKQNGYFTQENKEAKSINILNKEENT